MRAAIHVHFIGATNHRPARLRVFATDKQRMTLAYDSDMTGLENATYAVRKYAADMQWFGAGTWRAGNDGADYVFVFVPDLD